MDAGTIAGEAVAAVTGSLTTLVGSALATRRAERRRAQEIAQARSEARLDTIERQLLALAAREAVAAQGSR